MLNNNHQRKPSNVDVSYKGSIFVSKIVKDTCSVYMDKGRMSNIASKLIMTKPKCVRMAK